MKILCAEYNASGEAAIVPLGDDALLRNNGDFYLPAFSGKVSCTPQFVLRVCKLGKSVSERFANRYFEEVGVGIRFYADDLEEKLDRKGLPLIVASSFDSSAAISRLIKPEHLETLEYSMWVNEEKVCQEKWRNLTLRAEKLIALASDFHTLKIGDYLYCGNTFRYRDLNVGDRIKMGMGETLIMDFEIR